MRNTTAWDRGLRVGADGKGMVGHSGAVLLRRLADRNGLVTALTRVFPSGGSGWRDRAVVFVHLAISIVLGARSVLEAEQLGLHHGQLFGPLASDSTLRRLLAGFDEDMYAGLSRARAKVRRLVWTWLALRPGGCPYLFRQPLRGWFVGVHAGVRERRAKRDVPGGSGAVWAGRWPAWRSGRAGARA